MLRASAARLLAAGVVALAVTGVANYWSTATAATLTVQNNGDSGPGSLRAAIAAAGPGDTIVIPASVGPITLTSGELAISQSLTIDGAGAATTIIDGNNASRVVHVDSPATLTLSGVTVRHGNAVSGFGGGVLVDFGATLNLTASVVTQNTAGSNGGGIEVFTATVTITTSTIAGNTVGAGDDGGGIRLGDDGAQLTLANSTVTGNSAGCAGGGVSYFSHSITGTYVNDTINANTSGAGTGGGLDDGGSFCTTSAGHAGDGASGQPGGSVHPAAAPFAVLTNTIVSGNTPANCDTASFGPGTSDLELGTSCGFSPNPNADPRLGPLRVNPGPIPVPTEALLAGSAAIDAANNPACQAAPVSNVDERGLPRFPAGDPVCDIGAFEVQPTTTLVIAAFTG